MKSKITDNPPPPASLAGRVRLLKVGQAVQADCEMHVARSTAFRVRKDSINTVSEGMQFNTYKATDGKIYIKRVS